MSSTVSAGGEQAPVSSPIATDDLSRDDVCLRAALGLTNKKIAYDLGLRLSSVAPHLGRGLGKLGIAGRPELQKLEPLLERLGDPAGRRG